MSCYHDYNVILFYGSKLCSIFKSVAVVLFRSIIGGGELEGLVVSGRYFEVNSDVNLEYGRE